MTKLLLVLSLLLSVSIFANTNVLTQEEKKLDDEILTVIDAEDNINEEDLVELSNSLDSRIDSIEL